MRDVLFGLRAHGRPTVPQSLIALYVFSFFQAMLECLVYPHPLRVVILLVGYGFVGFCIASVTSPVGSVSAWRTGVVLTVFFVFLLPLRLAVYKFMGVN